MNNPLINYLAKLNQEANIALKRAEDHAVLHSKRIEVKIENDNDWHFVFIDRGNGVKGMSVF